MRPSERAELPFSSAVRAARRRLSIGSCAVAGAACLLAARADAQADYASVLTYRTVRVADGIYAFITPEERSGFQSGNSIAIIGDDGVLVFDSGNIPSSTRRQIAEIRKLTDKPVRYVVNSHWHPDHNLGNSEYRAAFPGVTIIGTTATRAGILERVPGYFSQMTGFAPTDTMFERALASGKMQDGSAMTANTRLVWGLIARDYKDFLPEVMKAHPLAPDLMFDDSLSITLGKRIVQLVRPGRGNTAGDAYAFVPDANVLLTGDLVTMPCPFPGTAFFTDWIAALDHLAARGATAIVPGHGDVQHDYQYVTLTRELLSFTRDAARGAALKGKSFEELQKEVSFDDWIKRFAGDDVVRRGAFRNFYSFAGLQRAYDEAKFLAQAPITPAP